MGDHEATLSECVRLLSSESRERKFMGMVLVTKLVHGLDQDALVAVAEADGFARFLTSMLRATAVVNTAQDGSSDGEGDLDDGLLDAMDAKPRDGETKETKAEQVTASHALALAVCATLARSPRVAADPSFQERLPLFAAAMRRTGPRYASLPMSAVGDACEACAQVIAAGGEDAERVAGSLGLIAAAASAVTISVAEKANASEDEADDFEEVSFGPDTAILRAVQLLGQLLESSAASEPVHSRDGSAHRSKRTFKGGKSKPSAVVTIAAPKRTHNPIARTVARSVPSLAWTLAARPGRPEQIEALRCLVLAMSFLPAARPEGSDWPVELARVGKKWSELRVVISGEGSSSGTGAPGGWLADLRGGLSAVLRSKATREMRHAALDLCSAACDLVGSEWLCRDDLGVFQAESERKGKGKTSNKGNNKPDVPFFRLCLELTRVETAVLLHDMSRDDAAMRTEARKLLPVPLVLFERLVGALASDAQAADESEDGVCLLSAETAQSAVRALCDTAGLLLEYLENVLDDGTDVTGDPDTRLAVTRAVGSFLAELPDPHASRLDSILPKLLSHHATPGAMCPDQAARSLTTRFMLPYLLQRTEDPHGLEAFERAKGPAALASLAERVTGGNITGDDGDDGPVEIDAQEAVGVVAAVCATLRNAMEGTERGHAEEALAVDAAKAFADVAGTLSEWAERVLNDRTVAWREGGDVEDATVSLFFYFRMGN